MIFAQVAPTEALQIHHMRVIHKEIDLNIQVNKKELSNMKVQLPNATLTKRTRRISIPLDHTD